MKKRKLLKRVLPALFAVVLMLSAFAVGASALTPSETGLCECILTNGVVVTRSQVDLINYEIVDVVCPVCESVYTIGSDCGEDTFSDYPYYRLEFDSMEDTNIVGGFTCLDENQLEVGDGFEARFRDVVKTNTEPAPPTSDSNMVGSMVGTMTQGVGGILVGIGNAIARFFENTVLDANGNLTTFAIWALAFLGIGFAFGVVKFITFLVKKN